MCIRANYLKLLRPLIFIRNYSSKNGYDIAIIGGGIVGTATAREILRRCNDLKCVIVEKEECLAMHQSSNNSGVIHAGIYYQPGSMKAQLCTEGMKLLYQYLDEKDIPYKKIGKLIVATDKQQVNTLEDLYERGLKNEVRDIRLIDGNEICSVEPNCVGLKAIHSPHTGIVDYGVVCESYGKDFVDSGGEIRYNFEVNAIRVTSETSYVLSNDIEKYPIQISSSKGEEINAGFVLSCAGLYADKVAMMHGGARDPAILPVRGEYLLLKPEKQHLVNGNIYPVPDVRLPFLGVHFTPKLDGNVWLGPNAILAFKREGYKYSDISVKELSESLRNRGFQILARKHLLFGIDQFLRSAIIRLQVKELRKYIPCLTVKDVMRGPSGVRAQAIDCNGSLVDDFVFDLGETGRVLHCRNAPSPAATSSLAIGRYLARKVLEIL
ncbi:hypothetical protein O3M35_008856 [Rhynocoris fuscipes]|uniref:L-2-hydroxyglutarate dehydrogenase, mitochondrial n=1 Tax=Rhynocoris fuscipes TaxID=488301 RepID=A0AAW1DAB1_9HEMI